MTPDAEKKIRKLIINNFGNQGSTYFRYLLREAKRRRMGLDGGSELR